MNNRREPTVPETRRRRASTVAQSERIMAMSRHLTLTRSVLADALAQATPVQLDFIERWFQAELDSRQAARRTRLLKTAGFPADKTLDGYDWSNLTMPADWDRARLESLDFIDRHEDLVLYGSVGTGKTHLAIALGQAACRHDVPTPFCRHELDKRHRVFAIVTSAAMFGLYHDDLVQGLFAFGAGLVLGFVAMEYSLFWAIALHVCNNALLSDALGRLIAPFGATGETVGGWVVVAVGLAALVVVLVRYGSGLRAYVRAHRAAPGTHWAWTNGWFLAYVIVNAALTAGSFALAMTA